MNEEQPLRLKASPELAARELRRLRRRGFRSPIDHVAVEIARSLLVIGPAILWFIGLIGNASFLGLIFGYLSTRWFEKYFKSLILSRFGPVEWRDKTSVQSEIVFDSFGLRFVTPSQDIRLGWSTVPITKVGDGMVFRIGPEMSIPVTAHILPDDWSMARFEAAIAQWRNQKLAE